MLKKTSNKYFRAATHCMLLYPALLLSCCATVHAALSSRGPVAMGDARNTRELFLAGGKWVKKDAPRTPPPGPMYPWWNEAPTKDTWDLSWPSKWAEWDTWLKESNSTTDWWTAWWAMTFWGRNRWQWSFVRLEWRKRWYDGYRQQWRAALPFVERDGRVWNRTVNSFRIPSMVEVDGVLIAIADARYRTSVDFHLTDTVAKYSADGGKTWKTEVIFRNPLLNPVYSRVVDPTVVVKGNRIFVLVGKFFHSRGYWTWHDNSTDLDVVLYVGTVKKRVEGGVPTATITWKEMQSFKEDYMKIKSYYEQTGYKQFSKTPWLPTHFLGAVGNGIVLDDDLYKATESNGRGEKVADKGAIIFPIQIKQGVTSIAGTILYSKDDGKTWKFGEGRTPVGCSESSVVEWQGKLLLMGRADGGFRKVYVSDDMGRSWEEFRKLSRVWGNSPTRSGPGSSSSTIKLSIEGREVILLTQPRNTVGRYSRDRLQLWMTDGDRVFWVGQISNGGENSPYAFLMHTKDAKTQEDVLYCLHEQNFDEVYSIFSVKLDIHMMHAKSVVRAWNEQDKLLAASCEPAFLMSLDDRWGAGSKACEGIPTMGLIGMLASEHASIFSDKSKWRDAFGCVDANIVGGTVKGDGSGVQFDGDSSHGVLWPVSEQGQDHRYEAVNTEHTIVSAVLVKGKPTSDSVVVAEKMRLVAAGRRSEITLRVVYTMTGEFNLQCVTGTSGEGTSGTQCGSDIVGSLQTIKPTGTPYRRHKKHRKYGIFSMLWSIFHRGTSDESNDETEYQLSLVMQDVRRSMPGEGKDDAKPWATLYVNGEKVSVLERSKAGASYFPDIQHFHMGGGKSTVKNVLLYNRELSEVEIGQLFDNMDKISLSERVVSALASDSFSPINVTYADE
ncbi:putative trans-sialidase [Trypanosoma vivax]|nr:putative trans-sialidase [Trypanosoma vivax]